MPDSVFGGPHATLRSTEERAPVERPFLDRASVRHVATAPLAVLLLIALGGCSTTAPPAVDLQSPALVAELPRPEPTPLPTSAPRVDAVLTLAEALALALRHDPALAASRWEIRAREAEALQASAWPNPEFEAEVENVAGTGVARGFEGAETTLALSQLVELGGKRAARMQRARLERDMAVWDEEIARIDALTATTRDFVAVVAAQEQLALADELLAVAEQVLRAVQRRVEAGATSPVEESRARVALQTHRIDRERRVRQLEAARSTLAAHWGEDAPRFERAAGDLRTLASLPPLDALLEHVETAPRLARWTTELTRRHSTRALASSLGAPDLAVGAGLRHYGDTGDLGAVFGLSLPLPFFDRNQGSVNAAAARILQGEHARRAEAIDLHARLRAVYAHARANADEVVALRDEVVPEAETAFRLGREAYERGRMRLTDVLDTERTLFELRARLVDALEQLHASVAELERLTGTPIHAPGDHAPADDASLETGRR